MKWRKLLGWFALFWRTKFETPFALNFFVCAITYIILWVYCWLCLYNVDNMFLSTGGKVDEAAKALYSTQVYVDAFFPSTLTLVISIIVQNMIECFQKKEVNWSVTAFVVMFTVVYTMICSNLRKEINMWLFCGSTVVLMVVCFLSILQIQQSLRYDLGISGEV